MKRTMIPASCLVERRWQAANTVASASSTRRTSIAKLLHTWRVTALSSFSMPYTPWMTNFHFHLWTSNSSCLRALSELRHVRRGGWEESGNHWFKPVAGELHRPLHISHTLVQLHQLLQGLINLGQHHVDDLSDYLLDSSQYMGVHLQGFGLWVIRVTDWLSVFDVPLKDPCLELPEGGMSFFSGILSIRCSVKCDIDQGHGRGPVDTDDYPHATPQKQHQSSQRWQDKMRWCLHTRDQLQLSSITCCSWRCTWP